MHVVDQIINFYVPNINLKDGLLLFMLILVRWIMLSIMIPFFGANILPSIIRLGLAGLLSLICFLVIVSQIESKTLLTSQIIFLLFIKEAFLGFVLGFLCSLIFYVYQIFGEMIDFFRAAGVSKLLVPHLKHFASPMGVFTFQLALIIFIGLGLEKIVIQNLLMSFEKFPPLSLNIPMLKNALLEDSLTTLDALISLSLRLSAPVVAVSLLLDMGFGLLNRIAPTINAYFLSLPAKMIGGLIIVFFMIPYVIDDFLLHYHEVSIFFFRVFP